VPGTRAALQRAVLGRPRTGREPRHRLLTQWTALPALSSRPLSSVAYATQEMMLVLALAGAGAFALVSPLSAAIALLLVVMVTGYRQTVRAYPQGGGAYLVARENLGEAPGLVAAGALLVDHVLTVAVSIAAGVSAIVAAIPAAADNRVWLAIGFLVVISIANLRGVGEAGPMSSAAAYAFVAVMLGTILTGLLRCAVGGCPPAPSAGQPAPATQALTAFLVLRAFASGAVVLAGVDAVSTGVTVFRHPQGRNAARTLAIMCTLTVILFLGVSALARGTGVVAGDGGGLFVIAEVAEAVFGAGPLVGVVLAAVTAILLLAANSAFAEFPRLASALARDRYLPRQFVARGDRMVFSNGILLLGLAAGILLVVLRADVTRLVQLYVVGVFTAFTLSQAGMVRHWLATRQPGWRRSAVINAAGAVATGVALAVVLGTRLFAGAWLVVLAIPTTALVMARIRRHYRQVSLQLRAGVAEPQPAPANHVVILLDRVDEAAARALSYAQTIRPVSIAALGVPLPDADLERRWADLAPEIPLEVLQPARAPGTAEALRAALAERSAANGEATFTTAIIPETLSHGWVQQLREHRLALRLKTLLLADGRLVVADLTSPPGGPGPYTIEDPAEHHVVVLVSGVHKATLRALAYAEGLRATSVRAMSVNLDTERTGAMLEQWEDWGIEIPLDLVDSPFRSLAATVRRYVREFAPDGRRSIVTCVLPEFVVARWWQAPLHNQTALVVKATLLFERGVVTTSVPYVLRGDLDEALPQAADDPGAGTG
jgi:amino acid transporter